MAKPTLEPLEISCSKSDCDNDLHCFRKTRTQTRFAPGMCQSCGANLIDWPRVRKKRVDDIDHTFESLKREWIRHEYWHREIDQHAINYARRKGKGGLRIAVEKRIRKSVAIKLNRDGRQTPWQGNPIYYAQHATACCCRKCIEYWHDIPVDRSLTEQEIDYFVELCNRYLSERFPTLPEYGVRVPPIRKRLKIFATESETQ